MAMNVPVTMLMSMLVASRSPWLAYHVLKRKYSQGGAASHDAGDPHDLDAVKASRLYKGLSAHGTAAAFACRRLDFSARDGAVDLRSDGAGCCEKFPRLKMLPFDNKNELLLAPNGYFGNWH